MPEERIIFINLVSRTVLWLDIRVLQCIEEKSGRKREGSVRGRGAPVNRGCLGKWPSERSGF